MVLIAKFICVNIHRHIGMKDEMCGLRQEIQVGQELDDGWCDIEEGHQWKLISIDEEEIPR